VLPRAAGLGDELLEAGVEAGVAVAKQHDVLILASARTSLSRNYKAWST
jgi:hypothetical protein